MDTNNKSPEQSQQKPLRLLPGVIIVIIQWLIRFGVPLLIHGDIVTQISVLAGVLGGVAIIIWWLFYSRARRFDRITGVGLMLVAFVVTAQFLHISITTSMMGLMFAVYSVPVLSLTFVLWAALSRELSTSQQRITMAATIVLSTGFWVLLRTEGMNAESHQDFVWRWTKSKEERLLASTDNKMKSITVDSALMASQPSWPGFRGINRDDIVHGVRIGTDWTKTPPVEMWRRPVGPGCSSFAINGPFLYTQEQRGESEMVACYDINTGEMVWKHSNKARFWDSHAGAGPRSTPTLYNGRVYTMGATGILNVLDAFNGSLIWSANAAAAAGVKALIWGFTGSPLVVDKTVIISLSGALAGYDLATGKLLWSVADGGNSYSSPHLVTIDGVSQVIFMSKAGVMSVDPATGKALWNYSWQVSDRIVQPAVIEGGDLLISGVASEVRRISVSHLADAWSVKEIWSSLAMKLYFNDVVINKGYAYGFDGPSITCIDLKDGKRVWRGAPYRGFSILLAEQELLLVLSEKGDLALVEAKPERFRELGKIKALREKTWNVPAIAGNIVVVRNSNEMVAYRLPAESL
jgi:outer membrane protein assembly factor BamB